MCYFSISFSWLSAWPWGSPVSERDWWIAFPLITALVLILAEVGWEWLKRTLREKRRREG